jgi:2-dehydropantoate 2-reductase
MTAETWIVGAGGIGSAVAGRLAAAEPLLVVDTWAEHVDTIARAGLCVRYPAGTVTVHPEAITLDDLVAHPRRGPAVVLLAVKSDATRATATALLPMLRPDTVVVSLQNGLNEPTIADVVGAVRTIGAVVRIDGALLGPGQASRTKPDGDLVLGQWPSGAGPAVYAVARRLRAGGVPVTVAENITGELWSKLIRNAALNALSAVSGLGLGTIALDDDLREVAVDIALEGVRVARALGIELDPAILWGADLSRAAEGDPGAVQAAHDGFRRAYEPYPNLKTSMLQDFEKGRGLEVDQLNGEIIAAAASVGVATPANSRIVALVRDLLVNRSSQGRASLEKRNA